MLRALVGMEESGKIAAALRAIGFDAWSCDLQPARVPNPFHIQGDVFSVIDDGWDLGIFHPDCTNFTVAGARWFTDGPYVDQKHKDRDRDIDFFKRIQAAKIEFKAIENPLPLKYVTDKVGMYDQKICQTDLGSPYQKGLCFWLQNLPPLKKIQPCGVKIQKVWRTPPGPDRKKIRAETEPETAWAIAMQWGRYVQMKKGILK